MNLQNIIETMKRFKNNKNAFVNYGLRNFIQYANKLVDKANAGDSQADDKLQVYWGMTFSDGKYFFPCNITWRDIWVCYMLNESERWKVYHNEAFLQYEESKRKFEELQKQ
mgnify:CR=1 FL=1